MEVQTDGRQVAGRMLGETEPARPVRVGPFDTEAGLLTLASLVVTHAAGFTAAYRDPAGQALLAAARGAEATGLSGHLTCELDRIRTEATGVLSRIGKLQDELADIAARQAADNILLLGWINKLEGDLQQLELVRDVAEEMGS